MKFIVALCLVGYIFQSTLGLECAKDFKDCLKQNLGGGGPGGRAGPSGAKGDFAAMKTKMAACFTSNGCKAPEHKSDDGDNAQGKQCREGLMTAKKQAMETCLTSKGVKVPAGGDHHDGGHGHHGHGGEHGGDHGHKGGNDQAAHEKKLSDACGGDATKVKNVKDCKAKLFGGNKPQGHQGGQHNKGEWKQKFCDAKKQCDAKLTTACKTEMETFHKAMCECKSTLNIDQLRSKVDACKNVPAPQHKQENHGCDAKKADMCA